MTALNVQVSAAITLVAEVKVNDLFKTLKRLGLAVAMAVLLPTAALAQATPDWTQTTPNTYGKMIALDRGNNAYVAGTDPLALTMLIKRLRARPCLADQRQRQHHQRRRHHDKNFNELWRKTYSVDPWGWRVAVDSQGNAIVAGAAGSGYLDWMTIKLDANGGLLWSRRYDQHTNDEIPYAMVVGPDDAIYITGQGGPGPTSGELSYLRTVTLKYTPAGAQVWSAATFNSVRGLGLKLGSDSGLFVVGESPWTVYHYTQASMANLPPVAAAAATTATMGPSPLTVAFSSAGSNDPDGTIVSYRWRFGDGRTSLEANPTHTFDAGYTTAGNYTATPTVSDNLGGAPTSAPITITAKPALATPSFVGFDPSTIKGGLTTIGTVAVSTASGVVVALSSSNPRVASVPASVQVAAGFTSATFTIKTSRLKASTGVTITATANGVSRSATLGVVK